MSYKYILGIDPSGAFHEGNGTTGLCFFNSEDNRLVWGDMLQAKSFSSMEEYWDAHCNLIEDTLRFYGIKPGNMVVVIEDYLLYADKAESQIYSRMETPKLIGVLQHYLWKHDCPYFMQAAARVIKRWSNDILVHGGYITKRGKSYYTATAVGGDYLNKHMLDAVRHAVHYHYFKIGESNEDSKQ